MEDTKVIFRSSKDIQCNGQKTKENNTMSKTNQQRQHSDVLLKGTTINKWKDKTSILVNPVHTFDTSKDATHNMCPLKYTISVHCRIRLKCIYTRVRKR